MKIAILSYNADDSSGTSVVALDQASLFSKSGHDVTVFTLIPTESKFEVLVKHLPPPLLHLPLWRYPWIYLFSVLPAPLHFPLIYSCIKSLSVFDVVVAYDYPLNWLVYYAKKRYRLKYLWFVQGFPLPEMGALVIERLYFRLLTFLYKKSLSNADMTVVETSFLQDVLKKRLSISSTVIKNLTYLSMDKNSNRKIREELQLSDDPLILYVDRIEEHKGIEILLDAFDIVLKKFPNTKLMIIGKCTRKHYWRKIVARKNTSIIFIDHIHHNEISAFYQASTIFATCAVFEEGLSHTILEAQAFGKPVVAFNITNHKEVVKNGETGILVDRIGDGVEFASALLSLLSNPDLRDTMGRKAVVWTSNLANTGKNDIDSLLFKLTQVK